MEIDGKTQAYNITSELMSRADADWEAIGKTDGPNGSACEAFRKINIEGEAHTAIQIKMVQTFPSVKADDLWETVSNIQARCEWDTGRWVKTE